MGRDKRTGTTVDRRPGTQSTNVLRWETVSNLYVDENNPMEKGKLMTQEIKFCVTAKSGSEFV